jgi:hypothetical protein
MKQAKQSLTNLAPLEILEEVKVPENAKENEKENVFKCKQCPKTFSW